MQQVTLQLGHKRQVTSSKQSTKIVCISNGPSFEQPCGEYTELLAENREDGKPCL